MGCTRKDSLRLDKAVLHEKRISEAFNKASVSKSIHFQDAAEAIAGRPNRKISRGNIKAAFGAFIQRTGELMEYQLTAPEIRRLFDAVAKDQRGEAARRRFAKG